MQENPSEDQEDDIEYIIAPNRELTTVDGKKIGRPKKGIDWENFEKLCAMKCTGDEIASFLRINKDTLYIKVEEHYKKPFPVVYKVFSEIGHCSLRRNQWALSKKNATMAIWLGKQHLGQRDPDRESDRVTTDLMEEFAQFYLNKTRNPIAKTDDADAD